jgi:hypothetical protein
MATSPSPPILVWVPGGGVSGGPISNPPVYSQADVTPLVEGQAYIDVVFGSIQTDDTWVLVACEVYNLTDFEPLNIWPGIITDRTTAGFRLQLNGVPDTNNYYLSWAVSGVNIVPVPATLYQLSGPSSGPITDATTFTVRLPPSTTVSGPITVTPNDGVAGGTFAPTSVTLTNSSASATFTYTPASYGVKTIGTTNSGTLSDPASIAFTVLAATYTFSGPSSGGSGVPSTNFSVALPVGGIVLGTVTVTPYDAGDGGTFTPTTVNLTTVAPAATFTYTPVSTGVKTLSVTNNGGLTNPGNLTYTAVVPVHLLTTLNAYWKLDEASGTRVDALGVLDLSPGNAPVGSAGKINNGCLFDAASSQYLQRVDSAAVQVTGEFTFSCWVRVDDVAAAAIVIISKDNSATREYLLGHGSAVGFFFSIAAVTAQVGSPATAGVWYHLVGWIDGGDGKCRLRVNDTTTYLSAATALAPGGTDFGIGCRFVPAPQLFFTGIIDEVGFWKRKLTSDEITALYNGGAGLPFSSFTS